MNEAPQRSLSSALTPGGGAVTLLGRIVAVRDHGGVGFADLVDRAGRVQLVFARTADLPPVQAIVRCRGAVVWSERAQAGLEVQVGELEILSAPAGELPFNPETLPSPAGSGGPALETLLDRRELSLRSPGHLAVVRVTSAVLGAVAAYLRGQDFVEIKTPKIVAGGTEGGAGLFEVRYFDRLACLAQSPQLYKQTLASTPLERVFEVAPAFRAEKHETGRHLNEFTSLDAELAYPADLAAVLDLIEGLVRAVRDRVQDACLAELATLGVTLPRLSAPFARLDFDRAWEVATGQKPTRAHPAGHLSPEHERTLCAWAAETHGTDALFVTGWPRWARPFYTRPQANPRKTESFDLLLRGLEISSGGLRIHDLDQLLANLERDGLDPAGMESYLQVFRTGCPPHGGFGIGLERLVQKLLDLPRVHHASLFPRDRARLAP